MGLLGSAQAAAPSTVTFELGTLSPTFSSVTNRRVDAGQSFTDYVNFNLQVAPLSSVLSALWVQDRYGFQPGSFTATLYDGASGRGRVVGLLEAGGDTFAQLAPGDYSVVLTGTALASPGFGASYTLALAANRAPSGGFDTSGPVAAIPEPQTWVLMLAGLGLLGWSARRSRL